MNSFFFDSNLLLIKKVFQKYIKKNFKLNPYTTNHICPSANEPYIIYIHQLHHLKMNASNEYLERRRRI